MDVPESVEDLGIGDYGWVEFHHDALGGPGIFVRDLLVSWVLDSSADVTDCSCGDSGGHAEVLFGAPEASSG